MARVLGWRHRSSRPSTHPSGRMLHVSHMLWGWFYCEYSDRLFCRQGEIVLSYIRAATHSQTRSRLQYRQDGEYDAIPQHCVPANVVKTSNDMVLRRSIGPPLPASASMERTFWEYLRSLGGEWMWNNIVEGDIEVEWIKSALETNTFIGVTDGSYNENVQAR